MKKRKIFYFGTHIVNFVVVVLFNKLLFFSFCFDLAFTLPPIEPDDEDFLLLTDRRITEVAPLQSSCVNKDIEQNLNW